MIIQWTRRQGYRMMRLPPFEKPGAIESDAPCFRGHSVTGVLPVQWPFARLTIGTSWASIETGQTIGINRAVVKRVRRIGAAAWHGVHFDTADGRYDGVIFFPFLRTSGGVRVILDAFRRKGWPVAE